MRRNDRRQTIIHNGRTVVVEHRRKQEQPGDSVWNDVDAAPQPLRRQGLATFGDVLANKSLLKERARRQ